MLEQPPELTGFTPAQGLWRLLRSKGYEGSFQGFQETLRLDGSPEAMTAPLAQAGLQARLALILGEEIRYLECPTLLALKDGTWLLLEGRCRKGFRLSSPRGAFTLSPLALGQAFSGQALDLAPAMGGGSLWRRLRRLASQHRCNLLQIGLATLLLQLFGLAGPCSTGIILNRALPDGAAALLALVAVATLLVAVFQAWLRWFRGQTLLFLVNRMEIAAERGFLDHLLRLPFSFLQKKTVGELLQAFSGLGAARELLMEKALGSVLDGAMAMAYLAAMAWTLPAPTGVVLLASLFIAGVTLAAGRAEAHLQTRGVALQARQQGYLSEVVAGIGTIKAAGAEAPAHRRWGQAFARELRLGLRQGRIRLATDTGLGMLTQGLAMFLLIRGGHLVLENRLPLGTLFAFLQLSSAFMGAMMGVVDSYLSLIVLGPQLAKTEEILLVAPEPVLAKPTPSPPAGPALMEDVWFRYRPDGPWILSAFNLRVEPGETFQLHGASGSGKTTILRLLAGLFTPEKGTISIAGLSPQRARHSMLYLPQFIQIMAGTVMENLRVLAGGAPQADLLRAARRTGLEELISGLPMGYNTVLGHGGGSLSGGQRQLIALTAALGSGRSLLLLDEAMANLDLRRSARVAEALAEAPGTVISASHQGWA